MRSTKALRWQVLWSLGLGAALAGCEREEHGPAPQAPVVTVSLPLSREVTDAQLYTGQTDAVESVEVRARVTGYLQKVFFESGAEVKEGDELFLIDPRPYKADMDKAEGDVERYTASLERLNADYQRGKSLLGTAAMSRQEFDKIVGDRAETMAQLASAKAQVARVKLNLEWTKVNAPIAGKIGRNLITVGNLVTADQTLLTTIVSQDPIYAYFDVDERTLLRIQEMIRQGKIKSYRDAKVSVFLATANDQGYPHKGYIDFVNNKVTPGTGTLNVRAVFPNKDRVLSPGLFVRMRMPLGQPHPALLVTERALGTDQGQKFLYLVNEKHEVVYRPVQVGSLQQGLRAIEQGLEPKEWVIVDGLTRVRPGITVEPRRVDMPTLPASAAATNTVAVTKKE